jgi:hypothetical protein
LAALPVDLLATSTSPKFGDLAVLIDKIYLLLGLLTTDNNQIITIAFHASRQGLVFTEIKVEHLNELLEHEIGITALFEEVNRSVQETFADELAIARDEDSLLFFALRSCQIVVFDRDEFGV